MGNNRVRCDHGSRYDGGIPVASEDLGEDDMKVRVTRFVSVDETHNYAERDVYEGETFYTFHGATYGCVDEVNGIALSGRGEYECPFFEFPRDAVEERKEK